MADLEQSSLERYESVLATTEVGKGMHFASHIEKVREAVNGVVYGPYIDYFLGKAIESIQNGENFQDVFDAIRVATMLLGRSERDYGRQIPGSENADWSAFQSQVMKGQIHLIDQDHQVPEGFGTQQAKNADMVFSRLHGMSSRAQFLLAQWNYDLFNNSTMLEGSRLISSDHGVKSLQDWTEQASQQSMPHLTMSNMAIGASVSDILSSEALNDKKVTVIDTGSGTGATLAAITLGIEQSKNKGASPKSVSLKGIEACKTLFDKLETDFIPLFSQRINDARMDVVFGDILSEIKKLPQQEGLAIITANYVWHRLPSNYKEQLIQVIAEKWDNVIFLVGDLEKNESLVNRRYFDLAINGPLNAGNIGLRETFADQGFEVRNLNEEFHSPSTPDWLAQKIGQGPTSDSLFYVAGKGQKAEEILSGWKRN